MSRATGIDLEKYAQIFAIPLNGGLNYNLRVTMLSGETESGLVKFDFGDNEPKGLFKLLQEKQGDPWFAVKPTNPQYDTLKLEVEELYAFLVDNRKNLGYNKYSIKEE